MEKKSDVKKGFVNKLYKKKLKFVKRISKLGQKLTQLGAMKILIG
jgi:hypothetical protein